MNSDAPEEREFNNLTLRLLQDREFTSALHMSPMDILLALPTDTAVAVLQEMRREIPGLTRYSAFLWEPLY